MRLSKCKLKRLIPKKVTYLFYSGLEYLKKLFYSHALEAESAPTEDESGTYKIDPMKGQFIIVA